MMGQFPYVFNYKPRSQNTVVDALSRQLLLLTLLQAELIGFDSLKDQYADDPNFQDYWNKCSMHEPTSDY